MHTAVQNVLRAEHDWQQKLRQANINAKRTITRAHTQGKTLVETTRKEANQTAKIYTQAVKRRTQEQLDEIQAKTQEQIQAIKKLQAKKIHEQL